MGFMFFGLVTFCFSQNRYYISPWLQKIFLNFNVLYDYEKLVMEDDFDIESNGILFEIALGYDFGRIVPRFLFDVGMPLYGVVGFSDGDERINDVMDTKNFKLGFEVGIKPIRMQRFDLIIPLGVLFCWTTYEQKNPSYVQDASYDRIWNYSYINLFSGLDVILLLNKHFKMGLFSRIGFPVKKEYEYKETLRGNYVWSDTGSSTYSEKFNVDIMNFSIGIGILANL
jgi:hypothetical protein